MAIYDEEVRTLSGEPTTLDRYKGEVVLIVNVASRCGFTPQYAGLEALQRRFASQGFSVLGFPCNQFGAQEPGSPEEIAAFCSTTYGVTFPMFEKVEVNGPGRHPIYAELVGAADGSGEAGDVRWNFEKFLVGRDGTVRARFRSATTPDDPTLVAAIDEALAA